MSVSASVSWNKVPATWLVHELSHFVYFARAGSGKSAALARLLHEWMQVRDGLEEAEHTLATISPLTRQIFLASNWNTYHSFCDLREAEKLHRVRSRAQALWIGIRFLKHQLRLLSHLITVALRLSLTPRFPILVVVLERRWFLYHGIRPPRTVNGLAGLFRLSGRTCLSPLAA